MSRELTTVQPLPPGDHAPVFRGSPEAWLPAPRHTGPSQWRVTLRAGGAQRDVTCVVGDPWTTRDGIERHLRWVPLPAEGDVIPVERWLPSLDGELFLVGSSATPSLLLSGTVDVPLGRLGEAMDAMLLGRVAQRTAAAFLTDIAERLAAATGGEGGQSDGSGTHQRSWAPPSGAVTNRHSPS